MVLADASDKLGFVSPYRNIKPLRAKKADIEPFSLDEVERMLDAVRPDYRPYLTVRFFTGLRSGEANALRAQVPVLPEQHASEDCTAGQRVRTRCGPPTGNDISIRTIASASEEGRDAVRAPQTHPTAGSLAASGPEGCPRRVPIGGDCAESTKNGRVVDAERQGSGNCDTHLKASWRLRAPFCFIPYRTTLAPAA